MAIPRFIIGIIIREVQSLGIIIFTNLSISLGRVKNLCYDSFITRQWRDTDLRLAIDYPSIASVSKPQIILFSKFYKPLLNTKISTSQTSYKPELGLSQNPHFIQTPELSLNYKYKVIGRFFDKILLIFVSIFNLFFKPKTQKQKKRFM